MNSALETSLIECLDALDRGEPVEQILQRYPDYREALRPMLETAVLLQQLPLQPSLAAQQESRRTFLAAATMFPQVTPASFGLWIRQVFRPVVSVVLVCLLLVIVVVPLSASAVPGDALYGVKRLVEAVHLSLVADPTVLQTQFNQERLAEIQQLLQDGRSAEVIFEGTLEAIQPDTWIIAGLTAESTPDTTLTGTPLIGAWTIVAAYTGNGHLFATHLTIIAPTEAVPPSPTATILVSPSPTPTTTPSATQTIQSTPNPTGTAPPPTETATPIQTTSTATSTATFWPTDTPTSTPPDTPTAVSSTPDEDDHDEEDESGEDNDNSGPGNGDEDNSGSDDDESDEDNSGSGSSNSGPGNRNP